MKLRNTAAGVLLLGLGSTSLAGPPPLDRPTPPPCCADGQCYANPLSFGFYKTRWRTWPLESMDARAAGQLGPASPPQGSDFPVFEPPAMGEEDRKAPPPTAPREDPNRPQPVNTAPAGSPGTGAPGGSALPPTEEPGSPPRRTLPAYEPQVPNGRGLEDTGPTTDTDPPPALPFAPRAISAATPTRGVIYGAVPAHGPAPIPRGSANDDPPPSLPPALASAAL